MITNFARAQNTTSFDSLLSNLKQYDKHYGQEKVHLHFDKPFYALGDTIWFKGYVVDAGNNKPSTRSRILHVELINYRDSICLQLQLPINAGFAPGDITLSEKFKAGTYRIRAYTNWMRNFDASWFFNKTINIVDPFPEVGRKKAPEIGQAQKSYDIQFFPEGGNLVEGIESTVGFKVVSSAGKGVEVSGKLIDEQNNNILDFKTAHAGMGTFVLTPSKGKIYKALINLPDSSVKIISLPGIAQSGYLIKADNNNPDSLFVSLLSSPDLVNKEEMVLMPLSNGKPVFLLKNKFPYSRVNISIPKSRLPGGIIQLTLFNSKSEPVAERLVFNNYNERIKLNVQDLKETYQKRGKTEFDIQAANVKGQPLVGSFSIAVTNADQIKTDEQTETTIFSNLLLTSDLKGYVENPNYYFIEPSPQKSSELDNLMLTQGWRRFVWRNLKQGRFPKVDHLPEQTITVSGTIVDPGKKPVPGVYVNLLPAQLSTGSIRDTVTGGNGHFTFNLPVALAGSRFILQTKKTQYFIKPGIYKPAPIDKDNMKVIDSDQKVLNDYSKAAAAGLTVTGNASVFQKTNMLKEVIIKDYTPMNKLKEFQSTSSNLNGVGNADKVFVAKDMQYWTDLSDLDGQLPGARIYKNGPGYYLTLSSNEGTHIPNVLILVDGVEGFSLDEIPVQDVESIEFMKSVGYISTYGLRGSGGVLLITTKKGPDAITDTATVKNMLPFRLSVYVAREFYSPKYDRPENGSKGVDMRTTAYWKPNIITGNDGKAAIEFYNTDVPGNYKIVIEGMSTTGNLCREIFYYKVQ
ncbi:MAG: TonB-dependent receptor plug domain-containing protein [Bacteroidota bacterium]|nr:TonB-dependent receptor plug domain-containing protein [Bacteroidota bacterium]